MKIKTDRIVRVDQRFIRRAIGMEPTHWDAWFKPDNYPILWNVREAMPVLNASRS